MNGPRINNDERGLTVNKVGAIIGLILGCLSILGSAVLVSNAFRDVQNDVKSLNAQLQAQVAEQALVRREVDQRVRALEQSRAESAGELVSLRRDLTEFRVEVRSDLQGIGETLDRIYRNGNGNQ
jgi:predicted  nucleic acid-binding Zn-ribbon protein